MKKQNVIGTSPLLSICSKYYRVVCWEGKGESGQVGQEGSEVKDRVEKGLCREGVRDGERGRVKEGG